MKTRKVAEKTLYCLSTEELLQTAVEVLEEVQCKNDATFYYQSVLRQLSIFFFHFADHSIGVPYPTAEKTHRNKADNT